MSAASLPRSSPGIAGALWPMSSTVLGYRKLAYARYPPTQRRRRTRRRPEACEHASYKTCRWRSFGFSVLLPRIVEKFLRSPPVFRKSDGCGISRSSLCRRSLTAGLDLNLTIPCARAPARSVVSLPTLTDEFVFSKSQTSGSKSVSGMNLIYAAPPLARGRLTARGRWT